jgi:FkbM family methyltransferase
MSLLETAKELLHLTGSTDKTATIIDGGCHHGVFARNALAIMPAARVLAFEPDPESWRIAGAAHAGDDRVEIINAALGASRGTAEFYRGANTATNSLSPRPEGAAKPYYPQSATLSGGAFVDVTTLDHECAKRGLDVIDLLKLDLQGGELNALQGAQTMLAEGRINLILCEVVFVEKYRAQPLFWRLCEHLDPYGYSFFSLADLKIGLYDEGGSALRGRQWNQADAIFLSCDVRKLLDA